MKNNFFILLMLAVLFFNGCATTRKMELTAIASPDQKTDPYGAVVSEKIHMVSIAHYKEIPYMRNNAVFNIIVENGGEDPLTISNENISMIFEGHDKKRTVKKLDVQSAVEFIQDVEYEYRKRLIEYLVQINQKDDSFKALSLVDENETDFYVVFPNRSYIGYLHLQGWRLATNNLTIKTLRETLPDLILNQETIMPRNIISTLISCRTNEIPRGINGDFKINVSIDGEEHLFTFNRR